MKLTTKELQEDNAELTAINTRVRRENDMLRQMLAETLSNKASLEHQLRVRLCAAEAMKEEPR